MALVAAGCGSKGQPEAPPAVEIARVHDELHFIERACATKPTASQRARIREDVDFLLDLFRRYPEGRFVLEAQGEEARMLSVLLVVREALAGCVPQEADRVDRAVSEELRREAES